MTVEGDGGSSGDEYEEVDALDDSDDDFAYEEVELEDDVDDLLDGEDEDFEAALRSLHTMGHPLVGANTTMKSEQPPGEVTKRPEVRRDHDPRAVFPFWSFSGTEPRVPTTDPISLPGVRATRFPVPSAPPARIATASPRLEPPRSPGNPPPPPPA
jgi:hypothetical protein